MNGIIVTDKPAGWTSMDVCARLRGVFHEKRIGHGGTLDPMATGVLPVFVGRATRAVEFATDSDKEYRAGIRLGMVTSTQDTEGEVLETRDVTVQREDLEQALAGFRGPVSQIPPMYSAVKINGKKLYQLARKGQEVERPPRQVFISRLEVLEQTGPAEYLLDCVCSKGTYVRTLCHDIGQVLGCGACMSSLRRCQAAGFTLEDAVPLEEVLACGEPEKLLRPVDSLFAAFPPLVLPSAGGEKRIRNGGDAAVPGAEDGRCRVYARDGTFLSLGEVKAGRLRSIKSFF